MALPAGPARLIGLARRLRGPAALAAAALLLAGCGGVGGAGGGNAATTTVAGTTLTVYASQPPAGSGGQADADVLDAERLALKQAGNRAGRYAVRLVVLDGRKLSDNARTAIQDPTTIAYLGELQPGTSQISVEILNQLGILEISPADTAAYLTTAAPGVPGSPGRFYPASATYHETFARVVATTAAEAKAQVQEMRAERVSKLYVTGDTQPYSLAVAAEVEQRARAAGLSVSSGPATAAAARSSGADAIFYASTDDSAAARRAGVGVLDGVAAALPAAKLFAPSGLDDADFVSALSPAAQKELTVSEPGFTPASLPPAGQRFASAFEATYGHAPATQAIFGYEAMAALLSVISSAGKHGNDRTTIVTDFRTLHGRAGAIGTYSLQAGDPTIAPFVFAHVRGGRLVAFRYVSASG